MAIDNSENSFTVLSYILIQLDDLDLEFLFVFLQHCASNYNTKHVNNFVNSSGKILIKFSLYVQE